MTEICNIKILLVDDKPKNLLALEGILQEPGLSLLKSSTGADALRQVLHQDDIALILLDVRLPDIDGFEVAQIIRSRPRTQHIPIIFLTAIDKEDVHIHQGYSIGAVDYIFKPFDPNILKSKVRVFIELHRKQAELNLQAQELASSNARLRELARSNTELEQFAYVASHDLREPLRTMISYVQLLERRYGKQLDERARELIGHAVEAAHRMESLIRDLLQYSRVATAKKPVESVSIQALLDQLTTALAAPIKKRGATIVYDSLPTVQGDATQLRQLFQNLLSNALKYCHENVEPRIEVTAEISPSARSSWDSLARKTCVIHVKDNGLGFEKEHSEKIFRLFQRLHQPKEYEGTGIGLAICKKIVERHDGAIQVRSTPGVGSTFSITLPFKQVAHAD